MKKINILIVLGLFVLMVGVAQPAQAMLDIRIKPSTCDLLGDSIICGSFFRDLAQLNSATSKFEGLLNAYSINHRQNIVELLSVTASDLSSSLEEFNTALMEIYPTLTEEEQLAVREAYSSLGLFLEDLVVRTNSIFGREVFKIEYKSGDRGRFITIIDDLHSDV